MTEQLAVHTEQYIFPSDLRKAFLFFAPLSFLGILGFSGVMYYVAYTQQSSKIPCFLIGVIFTVLSLVFTVIWCRNLKVINSRYYIGEYTAENRVGTRCISVELEGSNREIFTIPFSFGYSTLRAEYVLVSRCKRVGEVNRYDNLYKKMNCIWDCDCIIIPVTEKIVDGDLQT